MTYQKGYDFPYEGFVQLTIEAHFKSLGFKKTPKGHIDLCCKHPRTSERWIIEAKGKTSAVGLDFRTGIGQLVQAMDHPSTLYGLAVPDIPKFRYQLQQVSDWVREALGIHWLLVSDDVQLIIVKPNQTLN